MSAADIYRGQTAQGWTRIEMLLELYDAALTSIETCQDAQSHGDESLRQAESLRAQRILLAIVGGIDTGYGEIATQPALLCFHALECVRRDDFRSAVRVLTILRDAFRAVAAEAVEWERGSGSSLSLAGAVDCQA
ncbi:MAG: hypothetical protein EA424_08290 [Planctomycetaceae bacterium]|jgi:flagellar secretion chaperone FliS|nr:MAG: hypothetical protein EA424_08290 [Planctomycetaceae bacterium]